MLIFTNTLFVAESQSKSLTSGLRGKFNPALHDPRPLLFPLSLIRASDEGFQSRESVTASTCIVTLLVWTEIFSASYDRVTYLSPLGSSLPRFNFGDSLGFSVVSGFSAGWSMLHGSRAGLQVQGTSFGISIGFQYLQPVRMCQ